MRISIYKKPELRKPIMLAGFPGMGMVAKQVVDYFIRKLDAEFFGEIEEDYPSVNTILYSGGVFTSFPRSTYKFYYWGDGGREMILLTGNQQPVLAEKQHEMSEKIVEVARTLNVWRVYTTAAVAVLRYVERPRVYGVVSRPELLEELKRHGVEVMPGEGTIRGLNGLLVGYAKRGGIDGICLLGETYLVESVDVMAALAIMRKLISITGIKVDLTEVEETARKVSEETEKALREIRSREERKLGYIS